jgi:predicted dehydrogenase
MYQVGVIGCGYWGPNLIRNFTQLGQTSVKWVADLDSDRRAHMTSLYPSSKATKNYRDLILDPEVDIVAVATPVHSHHQLALEAIEAGKHVFVEKPIAGSSQEASSLVVKAKEHKVKLMVGHTFLYTAAVRKMKAIVDSGELGDLYYISCQRLNLGLFQPDINVIWDLAPHDLSIILYLLGKTPASVSATGTAHVNPAIEDVASVTLNFDGNLVAFLQTSWLDPDKIRKITVVGSKKMMVFDDVQPSEKIKIYDKGVEQPKHYDTFAEFHYAYKYGDILIPKIEGGEPLRTELEHFVDCIENDLTPLSDGENGLAVVKILEGANQSLRNGNHPVSLAP